MTRVSPANIDTIKKASDLLKEGQVVAVPTETVYGLAGNALDGEAVARIYEVKGRPSFNPLITHVPDLETARFYGQFSKQALVLASLFWPGPLTLVVKQIPDNGISELVTAGLETIALRVPKHPVMQDLLKVCKLPIAAPSANLSGRLSPTNAVHVADMLGDKVPMILAGGAAEVGLESTVVDMSGDVPTLLRPGAITKQDIEQALDTRIEEGFEETDKPKSPGLLVKHYAPSIPIRLKAVDLKKGEALLGFGNDKFIALEESGFIKSLPQSRHENLSPNGDLVEAASNLFRMLHELDRPENTGIAVMAIPEEGLGQAINDRLKRAVAK